jgi:hypothetical protein
MHEVPRDSCLPSVVGLGKSPMGHPSSERGRLVISSSGEGVECVAQLTGLATRIIAQMLVSSCALSLATRPRSANPSSSPKEILL